MNWTTEYPTQPGYYWIRKYTIQRYNYQEYVPDCAIVDIDNSLRGHLEGEDAMYFRGKLISAEWFGPIQPPQEEIRMVPSLDPQVARLLGQPNEYEHLPQEEK